MGVWKAIAVAVLAVTATPLAVAHFVTTVPAVVPSVEGWERITGDVELQKPRVAVQYEFYVNPERPAIYEVVRYRVTDLDPLGKAMSGYPTRERLQWDIDGRDLRRFACVGQTAGPECVWEELEKGGDDYLSQVPLLISLYAFRERPGRFEVIGLGLLILSIALVLNSR